MQPEIFSALAQASGLDVSALQREYRYSYASVTIRLAEVLRDLPLMAVLYERKERGDPADWPETPAALRATAVKRTAGFGVRRSRLLGGSPRKGRDLPSGSLAEQAARSGRPEYAEGDGVAAIATPVFWKGKLAKVIVVAVPWEHRRALEPQLGRGQRPHPRNYSGALTAAS
jgi:hypothetical protein